MPHRLSLIVLIILLVTSGVAFTFNSMVKPRSLPIFANANASQGLSFEKDTLHISTRDGKLHVFNIEIASSYPQLAQGLMYRTEMKKDAGMLFLFSEEKIISMWMKNTYIPLDMIFIRKDGTIARIEANTTPESLHSISSGVPVVSVLELNAGTSEALGIKAGDTVIYKTFSSDKL